MKRCPLPVRAAAGFLLLLTSVSVAHASEVERFDLASISLHPGYISASQLRVSSGLRAIAFSPEDAQAPVPPRSVAYHEPAAPASSIGIAVGDAGTILRSSDGGETWWPIDGVRIGSLDPSPQGHPAMRSTAGFLGMGSGSPDAAASRPVPMPLCEFSDVLWLSPRDVVIVGGGYEPVTGMSRGVCVVSHDAGESFQLADAHELPRMRSVSVTGRASLAARGDASEASGVNRFGSYDGGRTWVEDILPGADSRSQEEGEADTIATPHGAVTVHDICQAPDGNQFAVTSHGRIFRLAAGESQWKPVRGSGRQTGVLFVAASASQVPWSLVGRESLQENRRVTIVLDVAARTERPPDRAFDRVRAAAAMLGVSDVLITRTGLQRETLLCEHRPAVVALDDSLPPPAREAWLTQIEALRTRAYPAAGTASAEEWEGPGRVVLTRPLGGQSYPDWQNSAWQRAWNHASLLRSTALLTGPGVLAQDITYDALMLVAPGHLPPPGVEVATLEDTSGSVRRDVSLAAGLKMSAEQLREADEAGTASHRRLQITTARMSQTSRLIQELRSAGDTGSTPAGMQRLSQQVEHLLAITAPDDRTRLLWEAYTEISHQPEGHALSRDLLLNLLARQASPPSIRRWASLVTKAHASSVEQKSHHLPAPTSSLSQRGRRSIDTSGEGQVRGDGPTARIQQQPNQRSVTLGQAISPFQIAPVSYESEAAPAPQILVPETKPTVWQAHPRLHASPESAEPSADEAEADSGPSRINWDYHPVVMGARGIESVTMNNVSKTATAAMGAGSDQQPRRAAAYTPPSTPTRPLLDGVDRDACWQRAELWRSPGLTTRCVADEDYLYFAIVTKGVSAVCLSLDCDGDYFTALQFELMPDGTRRASLNGKGEISVVWYAAIASESGEPGQFESPGRTTAEIAIARSSLPAPVCRVRSRLVEAAANEDWEVMPDPAQWHPSRQSVPGRQY